MEKDSIQKKISLEIHKKNIFLIAFKWENPNIWCVQIVLSAENSSLYWELLIMVEAPCLASLNQYVFITKKKIYI